MNDPGVAAFFYPTRFADFELGDDIWGQAAQRYSLLTGVQWPLPGVIENLTFPLANPLGGRLYRHLTGVQQATRPTIRIKPLHRLALSTSQSSITETAPRIQGMAVEERLHQVRRCPVFWENLMSYASVDGMTNTFHHGPPIAHRQDQAIAICSLHGWFQRHIILKPHLVNGEPAVQDVIRAQLLDFADNVLQVSHGFYT